MLKNIFLAFIPVFVAVDAIGVLPIFVSLTQGIAKKQKRRIIIQSLATALCVAVGFIFLGKVVFRLLGILMGDFMIAGGAILFCIGIIDILNSDKHRRIPTKELGFVPLGTPLIVGPAVLTTALMIIPLYGLYVTLIAIVANVLLAGLIFGSCDILIKFLGENGAKASSKVMALLLSAYAVMMIRKGLIQILVMGL